ncbi:MAG: hypothetical protein V4556_04330 [Bacteroidota bacterium]
MKDTKFYPLLAISIVLLLASFILLCILGYNFYKAKEERKIAATTFKTSTRSASNTRDSLQKVYSAAIGQFQSDHKDDSGSTRTDSVKYNNLDSKLTDFFKLRNDIAGLLKDNSSIEDLNLAKQKIDELQMKVAELSTKNVDIEKENKRLNDMLAQLMKNASPATQNTKQVNTIERTTTNNADPFFTASDLRLTANNENNNEVSSADDAEKFSGTFALKNNANLNNAEVMVVIVQPDGRVLKNAWESGSFETTDGKKVYTRKLKFDYTKGEIKKLNFSLDADNIQKGNYTMQIYNKGKLIGKATKTVS